MCWSFEVSIVFCGCELVLAGFLFLRWRRRGDARDLWILPFALLITAMEFVEALLWQYGEPLPLPALISAAESPRPQTCQLGNMLLTQVAGVILYLQPIAISFFGMKSSATAESRSKFEVLLPLALFTLIACIGHLIPISQSSAVTAAHTCDPAHSFGDQTCTYIGPNHHLLWKFSVSGLSTLALLPNQFSYFLLLFPPLLFYRPRYVGVLLMIIMVVLLVGTGLWLKTAETFSVFCWMGIAVHLMFLGLPYAEQFFGLAPPLSIKSQKMQ